jgi:hypothetical protein
MPMEELEYYYPYAIYDNPDTWDREWYFRGNIRASISSRAIPRFQKIPSINNPLTPEALTDWVGGQIRGDKTQMPTVS